MCGSLSCSCFDTEADLQEAVQWAADLEEKRRRRVAEQYAKDHPDWKPSNETRED
jgi:hypothetical protein